jgi:flavoprotein
MAPDNQAIEWAQVTVTCSTCSTLAITTVGDKRLTMSCPGCGNAIDLQSTEAISARREAAARAFNQSLKNADA